MQAERKGHAGVEDTRVRILNAARALYEERGTRGTTTREVAERAGVNEATLFRHFGSKAALLDAMREESCGVLEFRELLGALTGDDVAADLRLVGEAAIAHMSAKRAMMCVTLAEEAAGPADTPAPEWRGPTAILSDLAGYLERQVEAGVLRGDPLFLARMFLGTAFSYVVGRKLWNAAAADPAIVDRMVDLFLHGARAK